MVAAAERAAEDHDGVLSRAQLRSIGVTKSHLRTEVRARRWRLLGRHTVAVHTGGLTPRARWRAALHEVGADAALDGVTALQAAGLKNYDEDTIVVSASRGTHPRRVDGVELHETRRRHAGDVITAGVPRVRPAVAAVRAALWARSNRQAALLLVMVVQQRITTAQALTGALSTVRRHRRRRFLHTVVADGAQALGELDFGRLCRRRGLPPPSRQFVRKGPRGRWYLDVYWEDLGIVVEIEGVHHGSGVTQVADALRQNALTRDHDAVLRIPLLGLRLMPDAFMDQVEEVLESRGAARAA